MDRTANLLGALGLALTDEMSNTMANSSGLSLVDAAALNVIGQQTGMSVSAIATAIGLTHPGAVRVVDRLEKGGRVERHSGPDGRTVAVRLTAGGRRLWNRQRKARALLLEGLVDQCDAIERRSLNLVVQRLLTVLTGNDDDAEFLCRLCDESSCPQGSCPVTLVNAPIDTHSHSSSASSGS